MNREIKFRAWDKENKEMTAVTNLELGSTWYVINKLGKMMEAPLMQWTGLKDRNGKEIYEGDIVAVRGFSSGLEKEINEIETIKDIREVFLDYNIANAQDAGMSIEVIGNIYEDSELLEKEGKE